MDPNELLRLADDLTDGLARYLQLEREIEDAGTRLIDQNPDTFELRAVASILEDVYTGAESLCQLIVKRLDRAQPTGKHWHKELLEQVSVESPGIRPAVLRPITVERLDMYRSFRHVARNIYGAELDWQLLTGLLAKSPTTMDLFSQDIRQFVTFLQMIAADLSTSQSDKDNPSP